MKKPRDYSCIFLSYDEPSADYHYEELKKIWPEARRVHGIKGLDAAHKESAKNAETQRFFVVDGDNYINPNFLNQEVPASAETLPNVVFSWGSLNNVNGLFYGNGGVKFWDRDALLSVQSHENAVEKKYSVDFCYGIRYQPMEFCASFLWISGSSYQAFRAGFREGVKFCLEDGVPTKQFPESIANTNFSRLLVWATVGRDKAFGRWAMLGARMGIYAVVSDPDFQPTLINDYESIRAIWLKVIEDEIGMDFSEVEYNEAFDAQLEPRLVDLGAKLNNNFGMNLLELEGNKLEFFRKIFVNPSRSPELQF